MSHLGLIMDSKTIRYNNTRFLVEQVGGVSNFAEKLSKGQSQTSQFAGSSPIKGIGNKVAREIEDAFNKPHGWLDIIHNHAEQTLLINSDIPFQANENPYIPVISWETAKNWNGTESLNDTDIIEWIPKIQNCGNNGFGLIVTGVSMQPEFRPKDRIYINPDFKINELETNDLVIVSFDNLERADFKKLIVENNSNFLEPFNSKYQDKPIPIKENCELIGKVIGLFRNI